MPGVMKIGPMSTALRNDTARGQAESAAARAEEVREALKVEGGTRNMGGVQMGSQRGQRPESLPKRESENPHR